MALQNLPFEVMVDALRYLSEDDLRKASRVSRKLYIAACDAGLCVHRDVNFDLRDGHLRQLCTFEDVVEYATRKPRGPAVSLIFSCVDPPTKRKRPLQLDMARILRAITKALPVLVSLRVLVPAKFAQMLYDALCAPAPRLRTLALGQANHGVSANISVPLPPDLFQQSAPRLREIVLHLPTLDTAWDPVPAFRSVERTNLSMYGRVGHLAVGKMFPRIRALSISIEERNWEKYKPDAAQAATIDLTGLKLVHLAISERLVPRVLSDIPLHTIRYVEQMGIVSTWTEALWPAAARRNDGALHARFAQSGFSKLLAFGPPDGSWIRAASTRENSLEPFFVRPLELSTPLLGTRLVSLVMADYLLVDFLACPAEFIALQDLYLDCTPLNGNWSSYKACECLCHVSPLPNAVRCPALENILLVCTVDSGAPVIVHASLLGKFGYALGLGALAPDARPELHLIRVWFDDEAAWKRACDFFACLWQEEPFDDDVQQNLYHCVGEPTEFNLTNVFGARHRSHGK